MEILERCWSSVTNVCRFGVYRIGFSLCLPAYDLGSWITLYTAGAMRCGDVLTCRLGHGLIFSSNRKREMIASSALPISILLSYSLSKLNYHCGWSRGDERGDYRRGGAGIILIAGY